MRVNSTEQATGDFNTLKVTLLLDYLIKKVPIINILKGRPTINKEDNKGETGYPPNITLLTILLDYHHMIELLHTETIIKDIILRNQGGQGCQEEMKFVKKAESDTKIFILVDRGSIFSRNQVLQ